MSVQGIPNTAIYQSPQEISRMEKQEPVSGSHSPKKQDEMKQKPAPHDEFIPSEKAEPAGLYKVLHDDEGNPKIEFDDPRKKTADSNIPEPVKETPEKSKSEPEPLICTTNTGKTDREIEKLREKKADLAQKIRTASTPQKAEILKRELARIESELQQKDNEAYRRQNAAVTTSG